MITMPALLARLAISATAALCLLTPGDARAATVEYAFAYIFQPSPGAPWQLHGSHTFNSTGGGTSFTRLGTGDYQVTLGNMSPLGNAQARAHGSNNRCKVVAWGGSGLDTVVRVRCATPAGAPVDDLTVIQYYHATGSDPLQTAYLWASMPAAASYTPPAGYSYNSTGGVNTIAHGVEPGEYLAFLPGLATRGGDPHVTAYGTTTDYCKIATWYQTTAGSFVAVRCFNAGGDPVDTYWSLRYTHGHAADDGRFLGAYALGNSDWGPGTPLHSYTPNLIFQFHTSGAAMVADNDTRSQIHMPATAALSSVMVTAVGHDNTYCSTVGWTNFGTETIPIAGCYDPAGNMVGSSFTMAMLTLAPR
jgi:hypothetical protein